MNSEPTFAPRFAVLLTSLSPPVTNGYLADCSMGSLYITNPYECFVLMCILSEDPLGTYADVWELSYEPENEE